jgi:flagellar biosynthesis/type III secretory pathway protein FliH
MSESFVSLTTFLRANAPQAASPPASTLVPSADPQPDAREATPLEVESLETIRAARCFRAGLADAVDLAVQRLLPEIAGAVLARELAVGAADVASIVHSALARYGEEEVLAVHVHPNEAERLAAFGVAIHRDAGLALGDVLFRLRSGTIDLRFEVRLQAALAVCAP